MLAGDNLDARLVYNALAARFGVPQVIRERGSGRRRDWQRRWRYARRRMETLGLRRVLGQLPFQVGIAPVVRCTSRRRIDQILEEYGLDGTPIDPSRVTEVRSVNDEDTRRELRSLSPEIVVVKSTSIISGQTLSCVDAPFVNMHGGITPLYRGIFCAYWALYNQQPQACGVTLHLVDEGIDTGIVLRQAIIEPTEADNFATYPVLQVAAGIPLLVSVIEDFMDGRLAAQAPPAGHSALWSHPTLGEYLLGRIRYGAR
jgi:folate-dependent phosphoribosylglycinamide formyltransferase PurN